MISPLVPSGFATGPEPEDDPYDPPPPPRLPKGHDGSRWTAWQKLSGHAFPLLNEIDPASFCSRCGLSLEACWGKSDAEQDSFMQTRCRGPYVEPWWLRILRRIASAVPEHRE